MLMSIIAENLLVYPPQHVIYGDYAYEVWDEEMIKYLMDFFRPGNMRVDILTKSFKKSHGNVLYVCACFITSTFTCFTFPTISSFLNLSAKINKNRNPIKCPPSWIRHICDFWCGFLLLFDCIKSLQTSLVV